MDSGRVVLAFTCESCGLPFLDTSILAHGARRCPGCRSGDVPIDLPDRDMALATENEIRSALAGRWPFVSHPQIQSYLDRLAARVAERIEDAPRAARVVLVDVLEHRALALPSGTILLSVGLLAFLEDEAELVFILGHELAHAASGEAAGRLSRLGFRSSSASAAEDNAGAWADAAGDLMRVGYGRHRERDADARALDALLALGHDPESVRRYLRRLGREVEAGAPRVVEMAFSHPAAGDRLRRVDKALYARVDPTNAARKVNREVFRRAIPKQALRGLLKPIHLELERATPARSTTSHGDLRRAVVVAAAIVAFASAVAAAVLFLVG